jgi:EAL domain-containing protein (putative c-di-GMP-specific phosphodiesterase class I)
LTAVSFGDRGKNDILKSIVGPAKGLEILTTAEGIETEEQLTD